MTVNFKPGEYMRKMFYSVNNRGDSEKSRNLVHHIFLLCTRRSHCFTASPVTRTHFTPPYQRGFNAAIGNQSEIINS